MGQLVEENEIVAMPCLRLKLAKIEFVRVFLLLPICFSATRNVKNHTHRQNRQPHPTAANLSRFVSTDANLKKAQIGLSVSVADHTETRPVTSASVACTTERETLPSKIT